LDKPTLIKQDEEDMTTQDTIPVQTSSPVQVMLANSGAHGSSPDRIDKKADSRKTSR